MFLHEVSRKVAASLEVTVADVRYTDAVVAKFGGKCCYCGTELETDRAAIEHLEGMNRFRAGLHIPGNVLISCKRCNTEKRRDDQLRELKLAKSGWESFLSHDSTKCAEDCRSCAYWAGVWPNKSLRIKSLTDARARIAEFRSEFHQGVHASEKVSPLLHEELERIYRECQSFATNCIKDAVEKIVSKLPNQPSS